MGSQNALAGQYSVKTGETTNIYCKADAPSGGWITHAFYELVDPNDAQYLALYSHSSDLYATVTGISPKSSVKIQVTYAYSYRGSYDQKVHVGNALVGGIDKFQRRDIGIVRHLSCLVLRLEVGTSQVALILVLTAMVSGTIHEEQ